MSSLDWLLNRCNEMDITEQLNWLGDATRPFEAAKEAARMRREIRLLRVALAMIAVVILVRRCFTNPKNPV